MSALLLDERALVNEQTSIVAGAVFGNHIGNGQEVGNQHFRPRLLIIFGHAEGAYKRERFN